MQTSESASPSDEAGPDTGAWALLCCGAVWSVLSAALAMGGHAPTHAPLANWYQWQAVLVVPHLLLMGEVYLWAARRLAARDATPAVSRGLRQSLGWPLLFGFVLPDLAVYTVLGFEALFPAMLVYGGLAVAASLVAGWRVIRQGWGLSPVRAAGVVSGAWLAQAVVGSVLLR